MTRRRNQTSVQPPCRAAAFAALITLAVLTPPVSAAPPYSVTPLGGEEWAFSRLNNFGQAVGEIGPPAGSGGFSDGLLWTPATPNGTSGSFTSDFRLPGARGSGAFGINASGQVVGESRVDSGARSASTILWTPTTPNGTTGALVTVAHGWWGAGGINDSGQIVGNNVVGDFATKSRAVLWTPAVPNGSTGSIIDLGELPGGDDHSFGSAINAFGQVVGVSSAAAGRRPFLWSPTTPNGQTGSMIDLGVLPGQFDSAEAADINDSGQVVGVSRQPTTGIPRAFLWTPTTPNGASGSMIDLGVLPGGRDFTQATAINAAGHIVGHTAITNVGGRAFLWTPERGMQDLNSLVEGTGWTLTSASDINDSGQVVGGGYYDPDGPGDQEAVFSSYLLSPIPEPTALLLAGAAGLLLGTRRPARRAGRVAVHRKARAPKAPFAARTILLAVSTVAIRATAAQFDLLATHPDAAAQSTASGQILATLKPFNGKLYTGFGNYSANSGPIGIRAFDPATGRFTDQLLTTPRPPPLPPIQGAQSEAIFIYREIGGKLYAPHIDPWPSPPPPEGDRSGYALGIPSGSSETWNDLRPVMGGHMFDIATFDGNDLWMVGAQANPATGGTDGVAWRSRDGGDTWELSLRVLPQRAGQTVARLYSIHKYNGKLYTQGQDFNGPHSTSKVFDGNTWSDGPSLAAGTTGNLWHPETFAGEMVYHRTHAGVDPDGSRLFKFNGSRATFAYTNERFFDYTISGDTLYALLADGRIIQTKDLITWTHFDTAPATARSLGVLDNTLYVGATGGQLYRYSLPVGAIPGDANDNGVVNHEDFMRLFNAFGKPGSFAHGDFNLDGLVNFADFQILERNWALTAAGTIDLAVAPLPSLPEPATLTPILLLALSLTHRRRPRPNH